MIPTLDPTTYLLIDILALLVGACMGSFLNVLALRTLAEESIWWPPSHCPRCHHRLGVLDNIPVLSWLFLRGRCRFCGGPISWQYPAVEAFTALIFFGIERVFLHFDQSPFNNPWWNHVVGAFLDPFKQGILENWPSGVVPDGPLAPWIINVQNVWNLNGQVYRYDIAGVSMPLLALGALLLAATLIAVSITDFREKLIPHDITYPSMIIGIVFSAMVRHDLLGAMAGIGASYILFDFIAFYGLKVYLSTHPGTEPVRRRRLRRKRTPKKRRRSSRLLRWRLDLATLDQSSDEEEPIEVMGGGDAVLSAVMAAYLGWQLLSVSLIFGFIIGTVMGLLLLVDEMRKANLLHKCLKNSLLFMVIGATVFGCLGYVLTHIVLQVEGLGMTAPMAILGAIGGALIGVVSVGTKVSKPYPFGPALAAGGLIAIFLLPNWVYLSAIAPTQH